MTAIDMASVKLAARKLEQGKLVAFPTETVYGLGGDAENAAAIADIYAAKGRPANRPSHPVAQALLREFKGGKGGVAAPSANKFGHVSPTTAQHVRDEFSADTDHLLDYILDGGQSEVGIESTILDLSRIDTHGAVLLRPGQISVDQITAVLGISPGAPDSAAPRASGTLDAHYAPSTPVAQVALEDLPRILDALRQRGIKPALMQRNLHEAASEDVITMPQDAEQYAHDLYAGLRTLDQCHAAVILVEALPQSAAWQGVNDRLRRAAFDSKGILSHLLAT